MRLRSPAVALGAAVVLGGCGGGSNHPHWQPTDGIEHLRVVMTGASSGTVEYWDYRPADGCWRTRAVSHRDGRTVPRADSTVVRGADGRLVRRNWIGRTGPFDSSGHVCEATGITTLQLMRLWTQNSPPVGTVAVGGRALQVFHITIAQAALGMAGSAPAGRMAQVVSRPPGRPAVLLYDARRRAPVRLAVPAFTMELEGGRPAGRGASVTRFVTVEVIPATPAALRVFDRPYAGFVRPGGEFPLCG